MSFFNLFDEEETRVTRRAPEADTEFAAEDEATLRLREEELDVHKSRVATGEVVLHKDIVEQEKTVTVPVAHDEVVIERRAVAGTPSDEPIREEAAIRIPVTAERVSVDKHTVVREEITARKQEVQGTEEVRDTLLKEVAHIDTDGNAAVTDVDNLR